MRLGPLVPQRPAHPSSARWRATSVWATQRVCWLGERLPTGMRGGYPGMPTFGMPGTFIGFTREQLEAIRTTAREFVATSKPSGAAA